MRKNKRFLPICTYLSLAILLCLPGCKKNADGVEIETIDGVTSIPKKT
jgi:hypothetical protein